MFIPECLRDFDGDIEQNVVYNPMFLDYLAYVAEHPFNPAAREDFAWCPAGTTEISLTDPYDVDHVRVAMLGVFAIGHSLLPQIIVQDESLEYGVHPRMAEVGLITAAEELEKVDILPIPAELSINAMSVPSTQKEVELVCGLQVYTYEASHSIETSIILNQKLGKIVAALRDILSDEDKVNFLQILQNEDAWNIINNTPQAQQKTAANAAAGLLLQPLSDFRKFVEMNPLVN